MTYDLVRQRVLLFGGGTAGADTWEWDGANWTQRFPATSPGPRAMHAMAYDFNRGRVLVDGGIPPGGRRYLSDTWEWDGTTWTERIPSYFWHGRSQHSMAYDFHRGRVLLTGGKPGLDQEYSNWIVEWDGNRWSGGGSWEGASQALAYDPVRRCMILFGQGATWEWSLARSTTALAYGTGCGGDPRPPVLASNAPYLGNAGFRLEVTSAPPRAPTVFLLAPGGNEVSVGGDCWLLVQGPWFVAGAMTNAAGIADVRMPLALDDALRGTTFHAQALVAHQRGAFGFAFTAGRKIVLGD